MTEPRTGRPAAGSEPRTGGPATRSEGTPAAPRRRIVETAHGSRPDAFGPAEWGLLTAIALIWGSSFVFIEYGLDAFAPTVVALARLSLGIVALGAFPRARRAIEREDWPRVALLGLLWMGLPLLLFPVAQQWVASAVAGMLNGAVPLFSALFAALMLRRAPRGPQLIGLLIGFGGVVTISWPSARGAEASPLGLALIILAVTLYGFSMNLAVPLQQRYGALSVLLRAQLVAAVVVAPFGIAGLDDSTWAWPSAIAMLPLGLLGTGLAYVAMTTLAGRAGAARGAVAIYFIPVVAIILGVTLRDERVSVLAIVGTGLVLLGAILTSRRDAAAVP